MKGWAKQPVETTLHRVMLAGRITDATTKQGIMGADVSIRPSGDPEQSIETRKMTTLEDGRYYFMDRPAGDYLMEVSADISGLPYQKHAGTVSIPVYTKPGLDGRRADIELQPIALVSRTTGTS